MRSLCILSVAAASLQFSSHLFSVFDPITWVGATAVALNLFDSKASFEMKWNNGDPIIIIHNAMVSKSGGIRGVTFGHVVITARRPSNGWTFNEEYDDIIDHELAHVEQHAMVGRMYLPMYGAAMGWSYWTTNTYDDNNLMECGPYKAHPVAWCQNELSY